LTRGASTTNTSSFLFQACRFRQTFIAERDAGFTATQSGTGIAPNAGGSISENPEAQQNQPRDQPLPQPKHRQGEVL